MLIRILNLDLMLSTQTKVQKLNYTLKLLETLSYKSVLARGYAVVRDDHGMPIASVKNIEIGSSIDVQMQDGNIYSKVEDKKN